MTDPDVLSPVERIPTDPPADALQPGIALCLSGGGYRAMLFHLGSLWRLNDAGYLPRLQRVSSVSGGSITAAVLGLAWPQLAFDDQGIGQAFHAEVVAPVRGLADQTIVDKDFATAGKLFKRLFGPGNMNHEVVKAYRRHLFGAATLQDLPTDSAGPRFVINAANLQSGALWRFSRPYAWDWKVGKIPSPTIPLAVAVAASSAFPPFLSPAVLTFKESDYEPRSGEELQRPPFTTKVHLTDGGVYDNLGLETAWKKYRTILVSDGGGTLQPQDEPPDDWVQHTRRVLDVIDGQVRSLRRQQVVDSYKIDPTCGSHREGAYWGIGGDIAEYPVPSPLPCPHASTVKLAGVPTGLKRLAPTDQERLINWGFAICDAAIRRHVDQALPAPAGFPYPTAGVG